MDEWIEELWRAVDKSPWGEHELIGAVWDLCSLAECGQVSGIELDQRLNARCRSELDRLAVEDFILCRRSVRKLLSRPWDHLEDRYGEREGVLEAVA